MRLTLVIGSKNLSSWSFRGWLALRQAGLTFEEVVIPMAQSDTAERIARWSPSGRVPVLLVDDRPIWDSLAIGEFAAEHEPGLWPTDRLARAHARSISAEMHSGFEELRSLMPMEMVARFDPPGRMLSGVARDISRIESIWTDCRRRHAADGPFLFGRFTVADAMYAPVVSRFVTYAIELGSAAADYVDEMQRLPAWHEWVKGAALEVEAAETRPRERAEPPSRAAPMEIAANEPGERRSSDTVPFPPPYAALDAEREARLRQLRSADVKPIGGGIHRRR